MKNDKRQNVPVNVSNFIYLFIYFSYKFLWQTQPTLLLIYMVKYVSYKCIKLNIEKEEVMIVMQCQWSHTHVCLIPKGQDMCRSLCLRTFIIFLCFDKGTCVIIIWIIQFGDLTFHIYIYIYIYEWLYSTLRIWWFSLYIYIWIEFVCSQFATTHKVAAYKIIHVYFSYMTYLMSHVTSLNNTCGRSYKLSCSGL